MAVARVDPDRRAAASGNRGCHEPASRLPDRMPGLRRFTQAFTGLLTCLLLVGCARIPESGPVLVGRPVGDAPRAPLRISGVGPQAGAGPVEIVRGFLRAAADLSDDRNVARTYLAGPRRESWQADASVVIYPGDSALTSTLSPVTAAASETDRRIVRLAAVASPGGAPATTASSDEGDRVTVTVMVPVLARVNGNGEYTISGPGDTARRTFGLVVWLGQWRIDTLADGSVLTRADFDTTYSDLPVYFPDQTGGWLVPDVRWFPVSEATATVLVKAVLAGPSRWLAPAVTTGAPIGTRLTASSVPFQEGTAMVDLTGSARQADPLHRQMLRAQLVSTLAVLPLISPTRLDGVTITVESKTFEIPSAPDRSVQDGRPSEPSPRLLVDPVVNESPLVINGGQLMWLTGRQLVPVEGLGGLSGAGLSWPASAPDGSAYAALLGGSSVLQAVAGGKAVTLISGATALTPPSFDPLGWVWTSTVSGGVVQAGRPGRGTVTVPTRGWPVGMTVTSLRISRDGARALVSGQRGTRGELFVCAVERDQVQVPLRLGPPQQVLPGLITARSAAWLDQRHAVVLGRRGTGPEQPWLVEIGGDTEAVAPVPGTAIGLTAGNGEIYAALPDGAAQLALSTWIKVSSARWPALPG